MDVGQWLGKLGLERYQAVFRENNVDGEILPSLTAEDLKDLGVSSVGDRRRLLSAIGTLRAEGAPPGATSPKHNEQTGLADSAKTEAERRQLTVMFCDLVGSTVLSGRLDPEDYREVIKSFQKAVSDAVRRFEGYVAKYLGDGVLVYFGYPQAHEDDAERAIRSALSAMDAVRRLEPHARIRLDARIGIATGLVVAGDIAEEGVAETGAISGETPNLAARLQSLASPGEIVISQGTNRLVAGIFECDSLGPQSLKGIVLPTNAWRVRGERQTESRFDAQHGAGLTAFVGRTDEVELLHRHWEHAKSGEGQIALISGEPGIGKSRLTQHVGERLAGDPHTAIRYQCSPHYANSALYPIAGQLALAAGLVAEEPAPAKLDKLESLLAKGTDDVRSIAPLFADLLSIPYAGRYPALDLSPQLQKARTLEALRAHLLGLAARQPVYLLFEDLHWSDPTTQELLDLIVEGILGARVLALMTFRPEYRPRWVGQSHVTLMALRRLNRRHCAEMTRHVAAKAALPAGVLDEIVQRTDGVPLFIEELTRALLEGGMSEAVPTTIQASLLARLDRLGPAKQVAQIGAVIGREFDHALLAAVSHVAGRELEDALARLVGSELVFRRGMPPDATYVFKHALVQDAAYESLLKSSRRRIHGDIAAALGRLFPSLEAKEPELLAHHYGQAGLAELAIGYWDKAGNRALERSADVEALSHFRAALALLDALPAAARRASELTLQIGLGSALTVVEGYSAPVTGAAYRRARELCLDLGDEKHLFQVLYGLWNYENGGARHEMAKQTAEELLALAKKHGEPGPIIAAHSALGTTHTMVGSWEAGRDNLEQCSRLYDPRRDGSLRFDYAEDPCAGAQAMNALSLWNLGYPDQAVESSNAGIRLAKRLEHPNTIGFALALAAGLYMLMGDSRAAFEAAQVSSTYAKEKGLLFWGLLTETFGGWALARLGEPSEGIAVILRAIELFHAAGNDITLTASQASLADAYREAGRFDEALNAVEEGLRFAAERGEGYREAELHRLKGAVLLERAPTDSEPAERSFLDGLEVARRQKAKSMELRIAADLARLWHVQGKTKQAFDLIHTIYAFFTEGFETRDLQEVRTLLAQLND